MPPSGTHTIADYRITGHVNLRVPKQRKSVKIIEDESDFEDNTVFKLEVPPLLCPVWLEVTPSAEMHFVEIKNCLE